jgi:uroporphyrinogen-III synthase
MVRGTVGAIGRPTAETLVSYGVRVDVVPPMASFGVLLRFIAGIAPP